MNSTRRRHHHQPARHRGAFTLVELVVVIGLMTLLVSILFAILTSAQETVSETRRSSDINENARVAIEFIKDELLSCKPPRNDRELYDPGHMFVIRNNPNLTSGDDELWFTTGAGVDSKGRRVRKNVRYFVAEDEHLGLKILKRQEFRDLYADFEAPPAPVEEDEGGKKKDTVNICEYVEHFDVQYLNFIKDPTVNATVPDKYIPELSDEVPRDINFRDPNVWKDSGLPDNQTAPPAIRITLVVRDKRGRQSCFIQRVFWVPFSTFDPDMEEPPPPTPEELEEED
ncbi:MAG: hypothetical protein DRP79_06550 [Planctomycetota bacterium]|nr:MAG: hypothetical protein DRP79_06550 [Planctomycetota bacterium]